MDYKDLIARQLMAQPEPEDVAFGYQEQVFPTKDKRAVAWRNRALAGRDPGAKPLPEAAPTFLNPINSGPDQASFLRSEKDTTPYYETERRGFTAPIMRSGYNNALTPAVPAILGGPAISTFGKTLDAATGGPGMTRGEIEHGAAGAADFMFVSGMAGNIANKVVRGGAINPGVASQAKGIPFYRGTKTAHNSDAPTGTYSSEGLFFGSSSPQVAKAFASGRGATVDAAVLSGEARFKNPYRYDAQGKSWHELSDPNLPAGARGLGTLSDDIARYAKELGHDGAIINNVREGENGAGQYIADTIIALQRGTVFDDAQHLMYSNPKPAAGVTALNHLSRDVDGQITPAMREAARKGLPLFSNPKQMAGVAAANHLAQEVPGIKAYHGSPHDFDAFSMEKIGTGEGAQAFGHGLYFAENEGVARSYRDTLSRDMGVDGRTPYVDGKPHTRMGELDWLRGANGDFDQARANIVKAFGDNELSAVMNDFLNRFQTSGKTVEWRDAPKGRMYEVNIKADPNDFLDWDKPLSQQSEMVQQILQQSSPSQGLRHAGSRNSEMLGGARQRPTALDQSDGGVGAPSSGVVHQGMNSVVDNAQVFDPVVGLVPVDMMNVLSGQQRTAQVGGHDSSMFLDKFPVKGSGDVPLGIDRSLSSVSPIAGAPAERFGVGGDVVRGSVKGFPTLGADELRHMSVPELLGRFPSRDAATEALKNQGIAGVKYLDQGSRATGQGTNNYVVFDDKLISILRKYGLMGGMVAGAAGMSGTDANAFEERR
jgi:hypothetical protein